MEFDKLMDYQNMVQKRLRKEQQLDMKIDVLSIINQLTLGPKNLVQVEQVILEGTSRGMSEEDVHDFIDKLVSENIIYRPAPGYLSKR